MDAVLIKFRYRCKTSQESWGWGGVGGGGGAVGGGGGQQSVCFSEIPLQTKIQWTVKFHSLRQTVLNWLVLSWL